MESAKSDLKIAYSCHRQRSHLVMVAGHGALVRYSLGTNVNSPIFHVPMLKFGYGAGAYAGSKWLPRPCIHTVFSSGAVPCFVLIANLMFQNDVWQGKME